MAPFISHFHPCALHICSSICYHILASPIIFLSLKPNIAPFFLESESSPLITLIKIHTVTSTSKDLGLFLLTKCQNTPSNHTLFHYSLFTQFSEASPNHFSSLQLTYFQIPFIFTLPCCNVYLFTTPPFKFSVITPSFKYYSVILIFPCMPHHWPCIFSINPLNSVFSYPLMSLSSQISN